MNSDSVWEQGVKSPGRSSVSAVGTITIDEQGQIRSFDAVSERIFGYTQAEVDGRNVSMLMPAPYQEEHDGYLKRFRDEGAPRIIGQGREVVGRHKNGTDFPVWLAVNEVRIGRERVFVGSIVELTEQKSIESDLAQSQETTRAILDTAINPIITIDAQGRVCSFNPAAEKLFGYLSDEVLGQNVKLIMPQPYHAEHDGYLSRYLEEGNPHIIGKGREVVGRKKDGTTFPMHLSVGRMDVGGAPMFVGIILDISERKAAELELARSLETTRAILDTAINPIITIDEVGQVCSFNPAAEVLFGYPKEEVLGQNVKVIMPDPYRSEHDGYLSRYLKDGNPHVIGKGREVVGRRKDGATFPMHLSVGRMDVAGETMFVGIIVDITERKSAEAELLKHRDRLAEMVATATSELKMAKEDAEAGARAKSAFLANMSHEIRTPMNAIIGFAEVVLQDDLLSQTTRDHVRTILRSSRSLLGIINDVLDISKLESGKFELEVVPFHLPNVLNDVFRTVEHQLGEKGLGYHCQIDECVPPRVIGDPTRLRQVLLNLLGNAIKFTDDGEVSMSVTCEEQLGVLRFAIRDTGIGMSEQQLAKVFDAFSQADASTTRNFGGTGLGTTISKQLVEQMNGKIWVESKWKHGSTFYFSAWLPPADAGQRCVNEDEAGRFDDYRSPRLFHVLLAEDLDTNASLAILRLSQQGHRIDWVKNGREALQAVLRGGYDLVLMDVMMPEMDGLEATRRIRAHELAHSMPPIPIVALTASVLREDNLRCLAAGVNAVEGKPVDFMTLLRTMESIVPAGWGTAPDDDLPLHVASDSGIRRLDGLLSVANVAKAMSVWQDVDAYLSALGLFAKQERYVIEELRHLSFGPTASPAAAHARLHALKGLVGNLHLSSVYALVVQLDSEARAVADGKATEVDEGLLDDLALALDEVWRAIATVQPTEEEARVGLPELAPADHEQLHVMLRGIELGLEQLNPDLVEPLLRDLASYVGADQLAPLWKALQAFDFDEAKSQLAKLGETLGSPS
ncbi:PAS domain S-box protein [Chitinibacteraceae bacterium HSL-7]